MKKFRVLVVTVLVVLFAFACMADTALAEPYTGSEPPTGDQLLQAFNDMNISAKKAWRATAYLGKVPDGTFEGALMYFFSVEAKDRKGRIKKSMEDIRVVHTDSGLWLVFVGMGQKFIMQK